MVERRRARNIHKVRGEGAEEVRGGEAGGLLWPGNLQPATLPLTTCNRQGHTFHYRVRQAPTPVQGPREILPFGGP